MLDTPHRTLSISIHALHEESDAVPSGHWERYALFQSTLSMRRATTIIANRFTPTISIHALHEESDRIEHHVRDLRYTISIHALHEESDGYDTAIMCNGLYFNPRSP